MAKQEEIYTVPEFNCSNCNWTGLLKECTPKEISEEEDIVCTMSDHGISYTKILVG